MSEATPNRDQVLVVLEPKFEGTELALQLLNTEPLPGFSGATACDFVEAGRGQEVLDYIAAVDPFVHA